MISLILSFGVLIAGYFLYGRFVEGVFAPDDRKTPAYAKNDGVDFMPMPTWKAFLVQLLNIAGTGPIFGALMGACFGPVVFLWIIFGAVLGGGVHDYMSGMISERHDGASIAELSGIYLGKGAKWIMRIFSILLLVLTGTVFTMPPGEVWVDYCPASMQMGLPGSAYEGQLMDVVYWSLSSYRENTKNSELDSEYQEKWDELEKSIVSNIADDVQVGIKGRHVVMNIIYKYDSTDS